MNWVDLIVVGILGVSSLLAFMRGMLREVLGIAAWVGGGFFADWAEPFIYRRVHAYIPNDDYATPAAYGAAFVIGLVFLNIVAGMIGKAAQASGLGGVDRSLGVVFGLSRGAAVVVIAYIVAGIVVETNRWPQPVLDARTLPFVHDGAVWVAGMLPEAYRPHVSPLPAGRETRAADFMQVNPQGRALGRP